MHEPSERSLMIEDRLRDKLQAVHIEVVDDSAAHAKVPRRRRQASAGSTQNSAGGAQTTAGPTQDNRCSG